MLRKIDKDINILIKNIRSVVDSHYLGNGEYARWIAEKVGEERKLGVNEYGCADAANILYTINQFPCDLQERAEFVSALQSLQNKESGLFEEATHHPLHTTAHCTAALELFDAKPLLPLKGLDRFKTKEGLYELLDGLDWVNNPWPQSHQGAGIYAALNLADEATPEWNKWYFDWFWNESDPVTGMWRKDYTTKGTAKYYEYMAAAFHYLFNHQYAHMPLRYPDKMIDVCIDMYKNSELREGFGKGVNFIEVDWVYCITRALRQCGHRYEECYEVLVDFADGYIDYLLSLDPNTCDEMNDLHMLFGAVCCLAELQQFLQGQIHSDKPLRLVLDRRPFI